MSETLVEVFEKELRNKILLKMIPNQCEDQILIKYFKYFDLEGTGMANLRDFIKTIEKIGVVMGKIHDVSEVFNHYDSDANGSIDYKKFAVFLFSQDEKRNNKGYTSNASIKNRNINEGRKKDSNIEKIHNFLKPNGGKGLIQFCKEFKIIDYNNTNRLNIDDFIKIIGEIKVPLNITEIQNLFHSYELNNNSLFYYEEMFKDLKNLYHNEKRIKYIESLYGGLVQFLGRNLKLTDMKSLINPRNHPLYSEGVNEEVLVLEFYEVVDSFQFIIKLPRSDSNISKEHFVDFFKFFGFGIEKDENFINYVSNLFEKSRDDQEQDLDQDQVLKNNKKMTKNEKTTKNENQKNNRKIENDMKHYHSHENLAAGVATKSHYNNSNNANKSPNPTPNINSNINLFSSSNNALLEKLRLNLKSFGRKSLFYLIKHFKYYDNGTKFISKFDFAKVMKDFRLNLTITDIEKIYEIFCVDKKQMLLNYEVFVSLLSEKSMTDSRLNFIGKVFDSLKALSKYETSGNLHLDFIKSFYNASNHPLGKEEDVVYAEFVECLELFHYAYKNKKTDVISYEEFEEFYKIISFLIEDDELFEKVMRSEWKKVSTIGSNNNAKNGKNIINKDNQDSYNNINEVKKVSRLATPNTNTNINITKEEEKDFNYFTVTTPNINYIEPTHVRSQTPVTKDRPLTPNNVIITNTVNTAQTPNRPSTPLTINMTQNEKEIALAQNNYVKTRTPIGGDAVEKLKIKLRKRGVRGLMNLHKQFLLNCTNPNAISFGDFVKVFKLQKIEFSKDEYDQIFERFRNIQKTGIVQTTGGYLNFSGFIRNFKKILPEFRLGFVEKAFASLDVENSEMLFIEDIKLKFDSARHPEVVKRIRSEDDIAMEFLDCFELNYNFLATSETNDTSNLVSFEEFANFYEYVSFLYDSDEDFVNVILSTWNLN